MDDQALIAELSAPYAVALRLHRAGSTDETIATAVGVDEIACLVDFGVPTQAVIDSFPLLLETKEIVDTHRRAAANAPAPASTEVIDVADDTVAALTAKHGVTHLQCTPSLAAGAFTPQRLPSVGSTSNR